MSSLILFPFSPKTFLTRELFEDGYAGVDVRVTPTRMQIVIKATRVKNVLGEKGKRIKELMAVIQRRFKFPENSIELFTDRIDHRALCAVAQAESLRFKLLTGVAVRRACYGVLRFVMENNAKGVELAISGKIRGQRAKTMKFRDGYMIKSGQPTKDYIDNAVRNVMLRQGILGIKVAIMLSRDPSGRAGPSKPLPDHVEVRSEEEVLKGGKKD